MPPTDLPLAGSSAPSAGSSPARLREGPLPAVTLILGGARAGKSRFAEDMIAARGPGLYVATAEAGDDEMAARIHHHRARRSAAWTTVEEPLDLCGVLRAHGAPGRAVLVDCLTLWLSNLMAAGRDIEAEIRRLAEALPGLAGPAVFVSNEVGLGIVPNTPLARAFRDHAGRLHQTIAGRADLVLFLAAGLPMILKDTANNREAQS